MHEGGLDWQLGGGELESLACEHLFHTVHFIKHLARHDLGHEILWRALPITHADFGGFLGNRLVRENADPDAATALDVARHGTTCGLNLPCSESATADCLETEFTKRDLGANSCNAFVAALLFFSVLSSSWLQHVSLLLSWLCAVRRLQAPQQQAVRPCRALRL